MMGSGGSSSWILSLAMVAVVALVGGGVRLLRGSQDQKRGWLMLAAAMVLFGNILIIAL